MTLYGTDLVTKGLQNLANNIASKFVNVNVNHLFLFTAKIITLIGLHRQSLLTIIIIIFAIAHH